MEPRSKTADVSKKTMEQQIKEIKDELEIKLADLPDEIVLSIDQLEDLVKKIEKYRKELK
jgi:flagellar hook-associated protein FlgK